MRRLRLFRGALSRWVCWGTNCDLGVPPVVFNDARAGLPMSQPRSSGPLSFPLIVLVLELVLDLDVLLGRSGVRRLVLSIAVFSIPNRPYLREQNRGRGRVRG